MSMAFPSSAAVRLGPDGRIAVDFGCPGCGYNLRSQALGHDCPECGRAIDARAGIEPLAEADPRYVRVVQHGAGLLAAGVLLAWPLWYPGLVVAACGVWRLTAPEPGRPETRGQRIGRNFARWFTAIGTPSALTAMGVALWHFDRHRGFGGNWTLVDALFIGTHALCFLGLMFAWRHLYDLASRADAPDAAVTLRRLWKRYFHVLVLIGLVALAVNAFEAVNLNRRAVGRDLLPEAWLGAGAALLLAGVFTWLWWSTVLSTRRLARLLRAVPTRMLTG